MAKCNYEVLDLSILLENFLNKKILKKEDSNYSLVKPRLKEELDKIKDQNHKDIILKKLTGRTLESIGSEYNVTRERIRQIIQKEIKKFVITREEEKYKEIFETYNFDCDLFCEFFNVNDYVYYYLREKYKMGDTEPSELIDSWNLDKRQLAILKRKYNLITYKGENIVVKKINILNAILKQSEKAMEYSEIMSEYNKIIEINNLDIDELNNEVIKRVKNESVDYRKRIEDLNKDKAKLLNKLTSMYDDKLSGGITPFAYKEMSKKTENEIEVINKTIKETELKLEEINSKADIIPDFHKQIKKLLNLKKPKKELLYTLIHRIEIDKDRNITFKFKFNIIDDYTFTYQNLNKARNPYGKKGKPKG